MSHYSNSDFEVIKACYQLEQYLRALQVPFTVRSLYERAYKERLGIDYDPSFLLNLDNDPRLMESNDEPYTTHTIMETLVQYGHEPLIRALLREIRRLNIGFTHAYIMGFNRNHSSDSDSGDL